LMHELKTHGCAVDGKARRELFVSRVHGRKLFGVAYKECQNPYETTIHAPEGELCIDNQDSRRLLLRLKDSYRVIQCKGNEGRRACSQAKILLYRLPNDFAPVARPIPAVTVTALQRCDAPAGEKEIRRLVSELGSASYRERAMAEKQLLELGEQ